MTEDEVIQVTAYHKAAAIEHERERCALLCEMRADISIASADRVRREGTFTVRAIWPPFKKVEHVAAKWEYNARVLEDVAKAFRVVADCIRKGYDPRKLEPDPNEQVKRCATCDGSCGSPLSCDRPRDACYCDLSEADCKAAGHPVSEQLKVAK